MSEPGSITLCYSPGSCSFAPHVVLNEIGCPNALAALPILETRGGSVIWSRGGKSYLDQRVLT